MREFGIKLTESSVNVEETDFKIRIPGSSARRLLQNATDVAILVLDNYSAHFDGLGYQLVGQLLCHLSNGCPAEMEDEDFYNALCAVSTYARKLLNFLEFAGTFYGHFLLTEGELERLFRRTNDPGALQNQSSEAANLLLARANERIEKREFWPAHLLIEVLLVDQTRAELRLLEHEHKSAKHDATLICQLAVEFEISPELQELLHFDVDVLQQATEWTNTCAQRAARHVEIGQADLHKPVVENMISKLDEGRQSRKKRRAPEGSQDGALEDSQGVAPFGSQDGAPEDSQDGALDGKQVGRRKGKQQKKA
jgi:hypothetical protein